MGTIIGRSPHPPTCVWVGWVFCYFRWWCLTSCFRYRFRRSFHHSFRRHHHPPHPKRPAVAPAVPISLSRGVQCCSRYLHGVE